MRKERGITLVALVITVIIMIILSVIAIRATLGDHGLISMSKEAAEKMRIAEYQEDLTGIGLSLTEPKIFHGLAGRDYLEEFKKKVDASEVFKGKRSTDIIEGDEEGEDKLRVVTKEGYVFDITEEEVKYVGQVGEEGLEPLPDIEVGAIIIEPDPTAWTSEKVTVSIKLKEEVAAELKNYKIQYTKDQEAKTGWTDYKEDNKPEMETNGTIYARIKNNLGETSYTASQGINNIDRVKPNEPGVEIIGTTSNSITVRITAIDGTPGEGHTGEESGIWKVKISTEGKMIEGEVKTKTEEKEISTKEELTEKGKKEEIEYTIEGLAQSEKYNIKVTAIDKAENESQGTGTGIEGTTDTVPGGTKDQGGVIQFSYNPDPSEKPWTNRDVEVMITSAETNNGYRLEWTKETPTETTKWTEYKEDSKPKMETNGSIYARLKDKKDQTGATATGNVTNIDKVLPNEPTYTAVKEVNKTTRKQTNIKITATASDMIDQAKPTEKSGLQEIQYSITGGTSWEGKESAITTEGGSISTAHTFEGLPEGDYTIKVKAIDKATNEKESTQADKIIIDTTEPTKPGISISGTTSDNTNYTSDIVVTLTPGVEQGAFPTGIKGTTYTITGPGGTSGSITSATQITLSQIGSYTITVTTEDNSGNISTETKTVTRQGTPPTIEASADRGYSNGVHSITITATGSDTEGGILSYKLSYGPTVAYGTTQEQVATAGQKVTFTINTGLEMSTEYFYKVEVTDSDKLAATTPATGTVKTYCVGSWCDGGTKTSQTCTECKGSKQVRDYENDRDYTCNWCNGTKQEYYTCWYCNGKGTYEKQTGLSTYETVTCEWCKGRGSYWTTCHVCNRSWLRNARSI